MITIIESNSSLGIFTLNFLIIYILSSIYFLGIVIIFMDIPFSFFINNFTILILPLVLNLFLPFYWAYLFQSETIKITISDTREFLDLIDAKINEFKYIFESKTDNTSTYKPSYISGKLLKKISVAIVGNEVIISGPLKYIRKIKKSF